MTLSIRPDEPNSNVSQARISKPQSFNVEIVKASTPIVLALIGGVIGIAVLFTTKSEAGFGLASTAIAGAAGLAQPYKDQDQKKD